jgi:hypothetical protein
MLPLDQIRNDIKRYTSILEQYNFGKAKTGEVNNLGMLSDTPDESARHLENVIREFSALLRDR